MTPKEELIESLRLLCAAEGGTQGVAEKSGVDEQVLYQVVRGIKLPSGQPRGIGPKTQKALSQAFPDWSSLYTRSRMGHWSRVVDEAQALVDQDGSGSSVHVPLLANAGSMGGGNEVMHDDVMVGTIALSPDWVSKRIRPSAAEALRFIHAYGDSMSPTFEDGDILLVDTGSINPSGADGVYVLEANHRLFIKRVTERLGGGYDVTSDNQRVKTIDVLNGGNDVIVKGRVVWAWNGKKL